MSIIPQGGQSPFDQIRHRDDSSDYWTGRELMPLLGYDKWERFSGAVDRAVASMVAQGDDPERHISRRRENLGTKPREDFRLSRFAAYLVAMNGDPRKSAIASAQAYFAVRTREAETSEPAPMTEAELMARAVLAADKTIKELQHKIDRDAPKVEAYDLFLDGTGCYQVATAANLLDIRVKKLWDWLYSSRYLIEKGSRRRQPRALAKTRGWFAVRTYATEKTNGHASATTYITVLGLDRIRCELIADGLITSQLFALPGPKQVTA